MRILTLTVIWLIALAGPAFAQTDAPPAPEPEYLTVDLGQRQQSKLYPLKLTAQNLNCHTPQDFRFDLTGAPWISVPGEPVVRKVAEGESKSIKATMDFRSTPAGPIEGEVRVNCETCGFIPFVKNCRISDKVLTLRAEVIASSTSGGKTQARTTEPPNWPPLEPGRLAADDPIMRRLGAISAVDATAVAKAMANGEGPCDKLRRQVASLEAEKIDCSKAEADVEAARAALAAAQSALDAERVRRAKLRAKARDLVSQYQAANAAADAAAAKAEAAQARVDVARSAALNAFLQHTGLDPVGITLSPPPGMTVVQPGGTRGRTPPYAQELPLGNGISIFYVDDGGLWNPTNSSIGAARLKQMFEHEIKDGQALLDAIAAAEAEAQAALDAAAAARAAANSLAGPAAEADAAAHGLPPLNEDEVSDAEASLYAAIKALEDCRRRAAQLAETLAQAQAALKDCEKLVAAQQQIDKANEAIDEAAAAVKDSEKAIKHAERARKAAEGADAASRALAHRHAGDANGEQADAEDALEDARKRLALGDPDGAIILAGGAKAAATRAKDAAEQAKQAAEDGVRTMVEKAEKTGRQLEAFFQWLKDQGMTPEENAKIDQIIGDLTRARYDLETGDPSDLNLLQMYVERLANALGAVGFARLNGVTASAAEAGASAFAGILYAILESELKAAARRVANDAFMQTSGAAAGTLAYWVRKAEIDSGLNWKDDVLVVSQKDTQSAKSYFIIRHKEPGSRDYTYQVFRSSASGGIEYLGETTVS